MFNNPFSFKGRIRRTEYGLSMIIYIIPAVFLNALVESDPSGAFALIALIFYVPLLWFIWAQGAKRCHDRNNSGWFQIIPFYGFWMLFAVGDKGGNDFGTDPKKKRSMEEYA
ncbi:DUF805 domain-containing protein [Nafulsella turpanensis]|uniref:DUF805 domain-containing protein n=1 Tax=Nafulsella turpanensis TaxID=1265690 RepID=UPI0003608303|nr:DUF805 domain-containing protein [Nafulsella turpanensis]